MCIDMQTTAKLYLIVCLYNDLKSANLIPQIFPAIQ